MKEGCRALTVRFASTEHLLQNGGAGVWWVPPADKAVWPALQRMFCDEGHEFATRRHLQEAAEMFTAPGPRLKGGGDDPED